MRNFRGRSRKTSDPLAFSDPHKPTREEIREFLQNCSSFDRKGNPRFSVLLDKFGNVVPTPTFMFLNATIMRNFGQRLNPNECMILRSKDQSWKRRNSYERLNYKRAKKAVRDNMKANGENPDKYETVMTILT